MNKEEAVLKIKDRAAQNIIETRIRKDNDSIYVNAPSREIKKWVESRRF